MALKKERESYPELAARLNQLIERPQFAGKKWDWASIGTVLDIPAPAAQRLVGWMRHNTDDILWTVGTLNTDYMIMPTKSRRDALDGILNQMRHHHTRTIGLARAFEVLGRIDPDPVGSRVSARQSRVFYRLSEDIKDQIEMILEEFN